MQSLSKIATFYKRPWFILLIGFALLFTRAWPRLLYPEVWVEDGTQNLIGYINDGMYNLMQPVSGYIFLVPKLITILSIQISFSQYPLISTILAWIVILVIFYIIATAPLVLRGGIFLAIACLLVPSDTEVFGLPSYTFWWTGISLFILVFWDTQATDWRLRSAIIVLSSLSSPVCLTVLPLFWMRGWYLRKNVIEINLALIATLSAVLQALVTLNPNLRIKTLTGLHRIIPDFLGSYLVGNLFPELQWLFGLVLLIFVTLALCRQSRNYVLWVLIYLWCMAVFMSISRQGFGINPVSVGPRYFFFPFIILAWTLWQIVFTANEKWLRIGASLLLAIAVLNIRYVLYRTHDRLDWQKHLSACIQSQCSEAYSLPVHYDGHSNKAWYLKIKKEQCQYLLAADPFYQKHDVVVPPCVLARQATTINIQNTISITIDKPRDLIPFVHEVTLGDKHGSLKPQGLDTFFIHPVATTVTAFQFDAIGYLGNSTKRMLGIHARIAPHVSEAAAKRGAATVRLQILQGETALVDGIVKVGESIQRNLPIADKLPLRFIIDNNGNADTDWLLLSIH